jgi:hypothetical protein
MILVRKYLKLIPMVLLLTTLFLLFPHHASAATLTWSGFTWNVDHDTTPTVGTRNPSSSNVWVDSSGYLHLRLRKIGSYWCGAQVQTTTDLGYGVYQWQVVGRPDLLYPNGAFAMFSYPRDWENGQEGGCEWDFEWGRWGNADRKYNLDLSSDTAWGYADLGRAWHGVMLTLPSNVSTYRLTRTRESMHFEIFNGAVPVDETATHLEDWLYAPTDWAKRIPNIVEPVLMNLYAFKGVPPSDGLAVEMVIKSFSFVPGDGTPSPSSDTPTVPSLLSPANGAYTKDSTPFLDWSTVTGASAVHYQLQVDNNADFSSPAVNSSSVSSSSYTVTTALANGTYYWRVRAVDVAGNASAWTSARYFRVDTVAPPVPSLISPANGAHTKDSTPFLDWSTVTDASPVHYMLQVDNHADFSSLVFGSSSVSSSSHTLTAALANGTYYWRVKAVDAAGNASAWTASRYFVVP